MQTIEKTLILAKTDVLERGILGRILQRFEDAGLKIIGAKMVRANRTLAKKHYNGNKAWKLRIGQKVLESFENYKIDIKEYMGTDKPVKLGELIHQWSIDYLTKNPVLAMVIEGPHAVERVEEMCGSTEPKKAGRGTIRGDFCVDSILHANMEKRAMFNLVHSSRTPKDAAREIKLWFKPSEIVAYKNKYEKVLAG